MDMDGYLAEHNDIARTCLKLGHNFVRTQKVLKSNKDNEDKKNETEFEEHEVQRNQKSEKNVEEQIINDNAIIHNAEEETPVLSNDNTLQDNCKLFNELNQHFQDDSIRVTKINPNKDEDLQLHIEFQVKPQLLDNNGKAQLPVRDMKLDLKIVFESEVEENQQQEVDGNIHVQSDKEKNKINFEPNKKKPKRMKKQKKNCKTIEDEETFKINESEKETDDKKEQKPNKEGEEKSTKLNEELKKKIEKEFEKSGIDIENLKNEKFDLSVDKQLNEKFLNSLYVSFERAAKPIEERIYNICSSYFPPECKLQKKNFDEVQTSSNLYEDVDKFIQQALNGKIQVPSQQTDDDKTKQMVHEDKIKVSEKNNKLDSHVRKKRNEEESLSNSSEKVLEKTKTCHRTEKKQIGELNELVENDESFDMVILYDRDQKNIDNKNTQDNVRIQQIDYNEEIMGKFDENNQQNVSKNVDHQVQELDNRPKSGELRKKPIFFNKQLEEDLRLQFCFFEEAGNTSLTSLIDSSISLKNKNSSELLKHEPHENELMKLDESGSVPESFQEEFDVDVEALSDDANITENEVQKEFKNLREKTSVSLVDDSIYTNELNHAFDKEDQIKLNESCVQELFSDDSDVDVETFSDDDLVTVDDIEKKLQTDSEVCTEMFEEESKLSSNNIIDEEDYCNSFNKCVEINEVIEIVEEYDVIKENNLVTEHFLDNQSTIDIKSPLLKNLDESDSNRKRINVRELNETKREQITKKIHSRSNELSSNMEQVFDKEQELINNRTSNHYQVHNEHQKTLLDLKNCFLDMKQEFDATHQNLFEKHQQKFIENKNSESLNLPTKNAELKLIDENLQEDLKKFEEDVHELESEIQQSTQFEENSLTPISKEEQYNIFEKLFAIHDEKLGQFAESTTWPQNCLYPSSLLDCLFEDPDEIKPNVLVVTLYPEDVGFSVKIPFTKNELPKEIFYDYDNSLILSQIENQKLPIELLDLLDVAEPRLYYSGCVIAEIHDKIDDSPETIFRILLRPSLDSILYDIKTIVEKNSHINWTFSKFSKLESMILLNYYPLICEDCLPVAGTAVLMQHQFLSSRSICLNPLTNDFTTSFESKLLNTDIFNNYFRESLELMDKALIKTSDSMDFENDENSILWEFGIHLKSNINVMLLLIQMNTDYFDFSLVLFSSFKVEPVAVMKADIQYDPNKLDNLISILLDILKKKINPRIKLIQTYKFDEFPLQTLKCFPKLIDKNIYKINHTNISELMDKFMVYICNNHLTIENYLKNVLESEIDPVNFKLSVNPKMLSADIQNTGETNFNLQVDHKIMKNFHFCPIKKISKNSSKYLDLTNMKLGREKIVDSPLIKCQTSSLLSECFIKEKSLIPVDSSIDSEKNSDIDLLFTSSFLSNDYSINLTKGKLVFMSKLLPSPVLIYAMSPMPCHLTLISSTPTLMSSFENSFPDNIILRNNALFETSIIDSSIPTNNLQFKTYRQTLTSLNNYSQSTDTILESVMVPTTNHSEHSINLEDSIVCVSNNTQVQPSTSFDNLETVFSQVNEETVQLFKNLKLK